MYVCIAEQGIYVFSSDPLGHQEFKTTIPSAVSSNNAATLNGGDDWGDFTGE